jgi:glycosyltransferase involved in cell wall biosynthesis
LFTGWLVRANGVLDLIEAYKHSDILRNCHLILAGDGDLMNELKNNIEKNRLHNISLLGWCKSEKIDELLLSSDVFVLPTYSEGFPNSILEALAKGLPIISTPVGGIPDSVIDGLNGFLIKSGDVSELKNKMEWCVNNRDLLNNYSKNSIRIAQMNHDFQTNCGKIFDLLR